MKVSILTLQAVFNYGTQLQAFATQEKLKEYFDEVNIINYKRYDTYGKGLEMTFTKGKFGRRIVILPTLLYWKKMFGEFQRAHLNLTNEVYYNNKDLEKMLFDSDAYISGSDQVWNSGWNNGILEEMYFSFLPKEKLRFAYSSSFGRARLSKEEITETKKFINAYSMISIREESGLSILKNDYGIENAIRLLDPTLAYDGDFWRDFAKKSKVNIKEKYILIYNLNRSKEFDLYAKELAKKTGYTIYRFCTRFDQIYRTGKSLLIPNIQDFVSLIEKAEYVLTDSFHATVFSMNLNTVPIVIYPSEYSNRISDFLMVIDCLEVHPNNFQDFQVLNKKVDFEKINVILTQERCKIDEYLGGVKEEIKNNTTKKLVSIIVPLYNVEKYIYQCITSLLNQTYSNIEIILIDDGSTDNSSVVIKNICTNNDIIKYYYQKNKGVSAARNLGISVSEGEYITFIDADDFVQPDYIEYLYNMINNSNSDISLTREPNKINRKTIVTEHVAGVNDLIEKYDGIEAANEMLLYKIVISSWNKMYRKELLTKNSILFNEKLLFGEGFEFVIRSFLVATSVVIGNRKIYNYRVDNDNSVMTKYSPKLVTGSIDAQNSILQYINKIEEKDNLLKSWEYSNWHTFCDGLNTIVGCNVKKIDILLYKKIKSVCRKKALCVVGKNISFKEKFKGVLYFISPLMAAKFINKFRIRKFNSKQEVAYE